MDEKISSNAGPFLVGVCIGSLVAILFAPKSGEETREYLAQKLKEGNQDLREKARELRAQAEDFVEYGREAVTQTKEQIEAAVDVGRETFEREKSKAKGA